MKHSPGLGHTPVRPENPDTRITGLSLLKSMGSSRGNAESGFIRSVDDAVNRFHTGVVVHLNRA